MPLPEDSPFHDFPDRIIGQLQSVPEHVRELVEAVAPALAARLNFKKPRQPRQSTGGRRARPLPIRHNRRPRHNAPARGGPYRRAPAPILGASLGS
jgi:hypothetical protein